MCGIFGLVSKNPTAASQVFKGLTDIEYRGYDSWGIAISKDSGFEIIKKIGFLPKKIKLSASNLALGHTRWATHGGVTDANAHPHSDCQEKIVLIHNGIVENYLELKEKLRDGHIFTSETDSEVVAHLIEEQMEQSISLAESVAKVFNMLDGLNALVVSDGKGIVACKKGSPLVVGKTKTDYVVASDPNAILPLTNNLCFLEDNHLAELNSNLKLLSLTNFKEIKPAFKKVNWDYKSASLNKHPHFMLKEIYEQPKVLRSIAANGKDLENVAKKIKGAFGTFLIACGSASYTALAGVYLFSKFAKKHINFSVGSEFSYIQDYLTPKSLLIAISQSGESMDTLEPVVAAKHKKVKVVGLVNVMGSTLYRICDYPVLLQAGVEKAVASTKALTAMFAKLIMLVFMVDGQRKKAEQIIKSSAKEIENIIGREKLIADLALKIHTSKNIYILVRGLSYPIALEAALKIKEVSYIHAEGFAGGELKHGVIALIDKGTPVIVFVPNDETKGAMLAGAMEVRARGAYVIGVGPEDSPVFDFFFEVKDSGASSIIPHTVFAQLLAYHLSVKLGYNPDRPRNLAKSVVVR